MSPERAPHAALDDILSQTRYLLIDFDGPLCSLFAGTPTAPIADWLRELVTQAGADIPDAIKDTHDWFAILAFAAAVSPALAATVEAELTDLETAAVPTAAPTAYAHEVLVACRDSARPVAIISNNSSQAVRAYLNAHDLHNLVSLVSARTNADPTLLKPSPYLIHQAAAALNARPPSCAVVGDTPSDIHAAHAAQALAIGYAKAPADASLLWASPRSVETSP
jgi:phosphoglycolate phosphatase